MKPRKSIMVTTLHFGDECKTRSFGVILVAISSIFMFGGDADPSGNCTINADCSETPETPLCFLGESGACFCQAEGNDTKPCPEPDDTGNTTHELTTVEHEGVPSSDNPHQNEGPRKTNGSGDADPSGNCTNNADCSETPETPLCFLGQSGACFCQAEGNDTKPCPEPDDTGNTTYELTTVEHEGVPSSDNPHQNEGPRKTYGSGGADPSGRCTINADCSETPETPLCFLGQSGACFCQAEGNDTKPCPEPDDTGNTRYGLSRVEHEGVPRSDNPHKKKGPRKTYRSDISIGGVTAGIFTVYIVILPILCCYIVLSVAIVIMLYIYKKGSKDT